MPLQRFIDKVIGGAEGKRAKKGRGKKGSAQGSTIGSTGRKVGRSSIGLEGRWVCRALASRSEGRRACVQDSGGLVSGKE